jgi:hypothetical protein
MRNLSFKLPDALHKRLVQAAKSQRLSKSKVVRLALETYLARQPRTMPLTIGDLIGDLAGSCRDGRSDLATNPKYMEDFGKDSMGDR